MYASQNAVRKHAFSPNFTKIAEGPLILIQVSKTFCVHGMIENMSDCQGNVPPTDCSQCWQRIFHKESQRPVARRQGFAVWMVGILHVEQEQLEDPVRPM